MYAQELSNGDCVDYAILLFMIAFTAVFLGVLTIVVVFAVLQLLSLMKSVENSTNSLTREIREFKRTFGGHVEGSSMLPRYTRLSDFSSLRELVEELGYGEAVVISCEGLVLEVYPKGGLLDRYSGLLASLARSANNVKGLRRIELILNESLITVYKVYLNGEEVYAAFTIPPHSPRVLEDSLREALLRYFKSKYRVA